MLLQNTVAVRTAKEKPFLHAALNAESRIKSFLVAGNCENLIFGDFLIAFKSILINDPDC